MDPVVIWLDRAFGRFAVWWVSLSSTHQVALFVVVTVVTSWLLLKWRDRSQRRTILWVLEQQLNVQASDQLKRLQTDHERAVREQAAEMERVIAEQREQAARFEGQVREVIAELREDIVQGHIPVQILAKTQADVDRLASLVQSTHNPPRVERQVHARARVAAIDPTAPSAYAHLLDEEDEECPPQAAPAPKKPRSRAPKKT